MQMGWEWGEWHRGADRGSSTDESEAAPAARTLATTVWAGEAPTMIGSDPGQFPEQMCRGMASGGSWAARRGRQLDHGRLIMAKA